MMQVIVCTDGLANKGLGSLDGRSFYSQLLQPCLVTMYLMCTVQKQKMTKHSVLPSSFIKTWETLQWREGMSAVINTASTPLTAGVFYQLRVTVSVVTIKGEECRIMELGQVADSTGGNVCNILLTTSNIK